MKTFNSLKEFFAPKDLTFDKVEVKNIESVTLSPFDDTMTLVYVDNGGMKMTVPEKYYSKKVGRVETTYVFERLSTQVVITVFDDEWGNSKCHVYMVKNGRNFYFNNFSSFSTTGRTVKSVKIDDSVIL